MTDYEKMQSGEIYDPNNEDIFKEQIKCLDRLYDFNATRPTELEKRAENPCIIISDEIATLYQNSIGVNQEDYEKINKKQIILNPNAPLFL